MVFDSSISEGTKNQIREDLQYCALDTKAMVDVLNALIEECKD